MNDLGFWSSEYNIEVSLSLIQKVIKRAIKPYKLTKNTPEYSRPHACRIKVGTLHDVERKAKSNQRSNATTSGTSVCAYALSTRGHNEVSIYLSRIAKHVSSAIVNRKMNAATHTRHLLDITETVSREIELAENVHLKLCHIQMLL